MLWGLTRAAWWPLKPSACGRTIGANCWQITEPGVVKSSPAQGVPQFYSFDNQIDWFRNMEYSHEQYTPALPSWTQVGNKLTCRNSEDAFVRPFSRQIGLVHGLDPNAVRSGRKQVRQVHLDDVFWRHSPAEQLRGGRVGRARREFDVIFRPRSAVSCREEQHCFPWLDFSNTQTHWRYRETRKFTMSYITLSISVCPVLVSEQHLLWSATEFVQFRISWPQRPSLFKAKNSIMSMPGKHCRLPTSVQLLLASLRIR